MWFLIETLHGLHAFFINTIMLTHKSCMAQIMVIERTGGLKHLENRREIKTAS